MVNNMGIIKPQGESVSKHWVFMGAGFLLGAVIFFFIGQNYAKPVSISNPLAEAQFGIIGKIAGIEGNILKIEVAGLAGSPAALYTVYIDGKTVFKKAVFPEGAEKLVNLFETKPGAVSDSSFYALKLGDDVVVESATNFRGKKEFIASKIELRVSQ